MKTFKESIVLPKKSKFYELESNPYKHVEPEHQSIDYISNLHNGLQRHYENSIRDNLNSEHIRDIRKYVGASAGLNSSLWDKHHEPKDFNIPTMHKYQILSLDQALRKNKAPHNFTVYSSTVHNPEEKAKNGVFHHPAYLSTSISPKVAFERDILHQKFNAVTNEMNHHVLKINVPEGHKGIYTPSVTGWEPEKEFLLPRGLNLKHVKTTKHFVKDSERFGKPMKVYKHIHEMEILPK